LVEYARLLLKKKPLV